ncbi:MAG: hypothetical protein ACXVXZ_13910 [Mycobacteriaceae bacterium]
MSKFNPGDKVLVDGNFIAEIVSYAPEVDRLAFVQRQGGGDNTTYGHISQYRLEHFPPREEEPTQDEQLPLEEPAAPRDSASESHGDQDSESASPAPADEFTSTETFKDAK